ncbi:protein timeless homolog [Neodiprion pinetum]|uniref:protein timeless homolog n=1 Tax=Neodiprion pinetum TaxID=441929 RepID=UPI001EDEC70A|nr:protein timeless homolog [Neodiprion pinetum]
MSRFLSAEIAATCAALGFYDGKKYHLERDCVETLKDLIRYLRRDDENHTIRSYLGRMEIVQTDLIKILVEHSNKEDVFEVNLRLLANLTSPALLLYNEEVPTDSVKRQCYLQLTAHLQGYKFMLGDERFWSVLCEKLGMILNIPNNERSEDRGLVIERILILARNVLQIPADIENEKRVDGEGTVHDQVLFALHTSGMVDMFLFIASNQDEQQYQMHILEIVSLMLREQSASKLASAGLHRSTAEKERGEAELLAGRQRENREKMEKTRKYLGSRHSRFGGTFVVRNMKAIGDNDLICHKPYEPEALKLGLEKTKVKRPKNKLLMRGDNPERLSALSVRLFLKEFCVEFLNGAYNPVMRYARSCITGGNRAQANDESYYLWALRYFMEFNRHYKFEVKYVSETISTEVFHLVQRQLEHYYEMMVTDKKKIPLWSRRLYLALKAYEELLNTLAAMDKCAEEAVRKSSKVIKSNVFYVPEYRETLLNQLLCYNEVTMSRNYLSDLVQTVHVFLKMLEAFCKQGQSIVVQRIKARQRRRASKKSKGNKEKPPTAKSLDQRWDEATPELAAVMKSSTLPEIAPFDATLDTPIDDQKADAMKRVQKFLRVNKFDEAIGLLRAAREVWPENDSFGHAGMTEEEEFIALREIYFADLGLVAEEEVMLGGRSAQGNSRENSENEDSPDDEEDEDSEQPHVEETNFDFTDFLYRFVNVKVVKSCSILLKQFKENTADVNHCTVKLLHRIAVQCKTPAMLFQASIFRTFQEILASKNPEHKELAKFATFIVRKFAEVAEKNPKAYMELLFWKTTREATEMVEGYGVEVENKKVSRGVWTDTEEDELRTLFMEHQTKKYSEDLVDWLLKNIINDNRTRRGVIKKLKEMSLIVNSKAVRNEVQKRLPKEWGEEEKAQLAEIWEVVKDDNDPIDMIYTELRVKRPKSKIKDKLLELGLAKDRKELRKKRILKNVSGKSSGGTRSGSDSESDRDDDDDSAESLTNGVILTARSKPKKRVVIPKSKKQPNIVYTNAQLTGLLKDVIAKNETQDALEWLKESLEDVLEDRDEESNEGVPLVPVTDFANAAMDSPSFQRLLRALGIEPPADEQETYWRIPSNMLSSTIRKRIELIADALDGKLVDEETPEPVALEPVNEEDDSADEGGDVFESVKKFFAPKSNSYEVQDSPPNSSGNDLGKIARKGTVSGPEEHETQEVVSLDSNSVATVDDGWNRTNNSRIKASILDSDSEVEVSEEREETIISDEAKRVRSDNSDTESPAVKKRRLVDSDDEMDEGTAQEPKPQRQIMISDDED